MKIKWDEVAKKYYETGVSKGVYYEYTSEGSYSNGEAWNGLTAVTESPSGAESNPIYADNVKYLDLRSAEDFGGTIEAYTYPDGFMASDGKAEIVTGAHISQQNRKPFGFSYQTIKGNDTKYNDYGYTIHLVYGATASPSEKSRSTVNDSPEATAMSWEFTTVPVAVTDFKPTAHLEIDSSKFITETQKANLAALEEILYGKDAVTAAAAVYTATQDATKQSGKTYYTLADTVYTEFTGESFADQTTYYELTSPAVEAADAVVARMPLPDEVITILSAA